MNRQTASQDILLVKTVKYWQLHMIQPNRKDKESLRTWLPLYSAHDKTENRRPGTLHTGPDRP